MKNLHGAVKKPFGGRNLSDEWIGSIKLSKAGRLHENDVYGGDDSWYGRCFEDLKDAVFIETPEGRIIDVNKAACQMLGYSKKELLKMDVAAILPPEIASKLSRSVQKDTVRKGVYVETENMRKDGTLIPVEVSCTLNEIGGERRVIAISRDITERRRIEDELSKYQEHLEEMVKRRTSELAESEDRFRKIFELTKDAIFIEKPTGEILDVNKAGCAILGYTREELLKMDVSEIVTPEVAKTLARTIKPSTVQEGVYVETQDMRKDGSYVPVEVSCTLVEIKGQPSVIAVLRDISERMAAEKTLRESEEWFRNIFNSIRDGIFVMRTDRSFADVNKAACELWGYKRDEMLRKGVRDIVPAEVEAMISPSCIDKVVRRGSCIEAKGIRKDGKIIMIEGGATFVEAGGEKKIIVIVRDISERKRVAERLRKSELKYRTLLENLPQKIVYKNVDSVYISCNENFARDAKMKPEEIVGKTDFDLFKKELAESYRKVDRQVMRSGKTEYFEERYMKGRRESIIQTVKTPVRDEKGRITGILGIFWDITRRKQDEEKLKKYQRRLEEMVEERTAKLAGTNERLRKEINERRETEKALRGSEGRLRERKMALERKNIALGEMIEQIGHEKEHVKNDVVVNVEKLLLPILRKLKGGTTHIESKYIDLLRRTCEE
ncbi:MAG: PAS domain S-box protein, partial [Candidatus Aureabacteria bacterium]|nr:PAS domain S-box protein [Candidatus Auribacterota bacterium]